MSKVQINNEIVTMRHAVRQARVHIARKLIREAKMLRSKRGDEKQQQKYKRKADRHTQEVLAMKKIPDDEVSRFAIQNSRSLQEVLADVNADAESRAMTRLANHKSVVPKIIKFKEKFPNYEEHLGPGKRKLMKLKRKAGKQAKKEAKKMENEQKPDSDGDNATDSQNSDEHENAEEEKSEEESANEVDSDDESIENQSDLEENNNSEEKSSGDDGELRGNIDDSENDEAECKGHSETNENVRKQQSSEPGSLLRIKLPSKKSGSRTNKTSNMLGAERAAKKSEIIAADEKSIKSKPKTGPIPIRIVSKEATVKRFTELLEEENPEKELNGTPDIESHKSKLEEEREVDTFFMTGDGEEEYLKVLVPKSKSLEGDEANEDEEINYTAEDFRNAREDKSRNRRNDKFFTKMDKFNVKKDKSKWDKSGGKRKDSSNRDSGSQKRPRQEFDRKENVADQKIHPSWEARRKQQEILKQGFQGKKIVFDD